MNKMLRNLRAVSGVGLTWGIMWAVVTIAVGGIIGVVDPDSIDPGEGLIVAGSIIGSMGLLSGVVFWILVSRFERDKTILDLSVSRAAMWGILGSAIVQLGFLRHGDLDLAANVKMGLVLAAFGGVIATAWMAMAQRWSRRRQGQHESA